MNTVYIYVHLYFSVNMFFVANSNIIFNQPALYSFPFFVAVNTYISLMCEKIKLFFSFFYYDITVNQPKGIFYSNYITFQGEGGCLLEKLLLPCLSYQAVGSADGSGGTAGGRIQQGEGNFSQP